MSTYDWLLVFHLLAAFCFVSGSVVAGILHWLAMRRDRPSEIAVLLGLVRPMVVVIGVGSLAALGFGIWLTQDDPDGISLADGWVIAAIVLWFAAGALAGPAGKRLRHARELAERMAADGDRPSEALHAAVADRSALALNYASFAMVIAILALMVFKPGAG
jgi:uncharacterized membrane protein